jgi:hypothetical protein
LPGTLTQTAYNHYSLLRSIEDIYGLPHLGYAQLPGVTPLGQDVFTCTPPDLPPAAQRRLPRGSVIEGLRVARGRGGGRASVHLRAVRIAQLTLVVRRAGRRPTATTRWLAPCNSYTIRLPAGHGTVDVSASVSSGAQAASLRY